MSGRSDEVAITADGFHMLIDDDMAVRARVMNGAMGTSGDLANPWESGRCRGLFKRLKDHGWRKNQEDE